MSRHTMPSRAQQDKVITIDATDQPIGRLASTVAAYLRGKYETSFKPYTLPAVRVVITNIDKVAVSERKLTQNKHWHASGYPGGMKSKSWDSMYAQGPEVLFMEIIKNMLPHNTFRVEMLRRISFQK